MALPALKTLAGKENTSQYVIKYFTAGKENTSQYFTKYFTAGKEVLYNLCRQICHQLKQIESKETEKVSH